MSDEEIKKCLECCISLSCEGCPLKNNHGCLTISDKKALDLINRQQAEIERLKYLLEREEKATESFSKQCYKDGIKEFAERLKSKYTNVVSCNAGYVYGTIKEVEKEMVGEQDA